MDEVDDAFPGCFVLGCVQPGAAGRNAALRRNAGHLGDNETRPALGAFGQMHEMPIRRRAVDGPILRHRRDDDPVLEMQIAQAEWREHRRSRTARSLACRLLLEPHLRTFEPCRIASPQVLVADALRAGQQRIVELHRVEMQIALDLLEPFRRVARRALQLEDLGAALILIALQGRLHPGFGVQVFGESHGAFERELGAGPNREVRGGGSISEQHDIAVRPPLAQHAVEVEPGRAAQVAGVAHQAMTAEVAGKDALAGCNCLLLAHAVEAHPPPGRLRAFDDEGRRVGIELVGVRPDPAVLGFLEDEREGVVEFLLRAEPDVLGVANVDVRAKGIRDRAAHFRIGTVGCHDEIVVAVCIDAVGLGLEADLDPETASAVLQDIEQTPAADAAEAVTRRARDGAAIEYGDIVPIDE